MYHRFSSFFPSLLSRVSGRERLCLGSLILVNARCCFPSDEPPLPPLVIFPKLKKASRCPRKVLQKSSQTVILSNDLSSDGIVPCRLGEIRTELADKGALGFLQFF